MRSDGEIFFRPLLSDLSDLGQAAEQVKAEHLLAVRAIEALDVSILRCFTWFNQIQHDVMSLDPGFKFLWNA